MDSHHDLVLLETETCRGLLIEDFGHRLHFEIVIAGAERAHLSPLALLRTLGDVAGLGARHLASFLDAVEIASFTPSALDRPAGATRKHGVHFEGIEDDRAFAAEASGNLLIERVGERPLHLLDVGNRKSGQHGSHAAGDVEADAAGGNDTALFRVERSHATDGEAISPMRVGHDIGRLDDPGQRGDVGGLLVDLVVHGPDEVFIGVDDAGHAHGAGRLDLPCRFVDTGEACRIHFAHLHQTSITQPADQSPSAPCATRSAV